MPDQSIVDYATERGYHRQTLERWLKLPAPDQGALLGLARGLRLGENHFRDFLDWLEEIRLRDGVGAEEILRQDAIASVRSDPRLSRNDRLGRIKEEVRRLRFPRLARIEGEIQKRVRKLKLRPEIQIVVPSSLEGGALSVQIKAAGREEMRRCVREVEGLLEGTEMKEIFDLLGGAEL